jgi:predicted transcriptional regulator
MREAAAMTDKQLVMKAVREIPDDATMDEIEERAAILAAIRRGEEDIEAGRFVTHEELKRQVAQWLSN